VHIGGYLYRATDRDGRYRHLATLVYPSYTESIRKARRSDTTTDLMEAARTLERCYPQLGNVYDHESCPIRSTVEIDSSEGFY